MPRADTCTSWQPKRPQLKATTLQAARKLEQIDVEIILNQSKKIAVLRGDTFIAPPFLQCLNLKTKLHKQAINNARPSYGLIVHYTDADCEYGNQDKPMSIGRLVTALQPPQKTDGHSPT